MKHFIVAEAGCNHGGDLEVAGEMIRQASFAGADAVKFQYYSTKEIMEYEEAHPPSKYTPQIYEVIKKAELKLKDLELLAKYCEMENLEFMCTPFINPKRVKDLDYLVERWKIRERDSGNAELIEAALSTAKDVYVSVSRLEKGQPWNLNAQIISCKLLFTIPKYPATVQEFMEQFMSKIEGSFRIFDGYSNHVPGAVAAIIMAAQASVDRKEEWYTEIHVTLDHSRKDVDDAVSMDFRELGRLTTALGGF